MLSQLTNPEFFIKLFTAIFLTILFLQSSSDKIIDWKGNLDWLNGHFAKTPLAKMVPMMLATMTVFEFSAGLLSGIGAVMLLISNKGTIALYGAQVSALSITMLFFGQRIAKDYEGAATLVSYFILCVFSIYVHG